MFVFTRVGRLDGYRLDGQAQYPEPFNAPLREALLNPGQFSGIERLVHFTVTDMGAYGQNIVQRALGDQQRGCPALSRNDAQSLAYEVIGYFTQLGDVLQIEFALRRYGFVQWICQTGLQTRVP